MTKLEQYAKRLGIKIPKATASPLDIEAGKAGYEKYLADVEAAKNAKVESEESKSWWERKVAPLIMASFKASSQGDSLPAVAFNQSVDAYKNIPDDYNSKPTDDWTDEERWAFGEKYATDKGAAYLFAKELNESKTAEKKRKQQENLAKWTNKNAVNRILGSAASIGLNATYGSLGYLDALAQKAAGKDELIQHEFLLPHEVANTMQGSVAQHLNDTFGTINEDVWLLGGKGLGDVYGLSMSIGQSALAGGATKLSGNSAYTLASYFGMAASNGVSDAIERGATANQALAFGTISGAAEAITEMISVDKLVGIASAEGVQNVFKNVLKQAGQEAGEEFTTSVINNVADRWIMGGKSQFQTTVNQLVASGMSPEEAKKKAWKQTIEDIAFDTLSGALSGGISGAGATAINRGVNQFGLTKDARAANKNALETYTPIQSDLIAEGKQHKTSEKIATKLENKLAKGKELSGYDLRTLAYETQNAQRTADVETTRNAIVEKMKAEGLDESKAKRLGEIALNKAIGHDISKLQEVQLKNNEIASKVYNQISQEVMDSGVGESDWARATPIESLREELKAEKLAENGGIQENEATKRKTPETAMQNAEITSEIATAEKLKKMNNAAVSDSAKLDTLNQLVQESKARGTIGKIEQIKAKNNQAVQMEATPSTEQAISEAVKKITDKDLRGKYTTTTEGKVEYKKSKDSKLNTDGISSSLTNEDIRELAAIEKIANELGVEIHVYETQEKNGHRVYTDKDGKRYTDSGYYDTKNNTIHIDLRAGMKGEGTMLYTASHEVVHFIKKNASDHFNALEKLVTKALKDGGYSIEKLLDKQKDILKQSGWKGTEDNFDEVAREEMVADACMKFLASKNAVAQIQALKTENKGLWSALKRFFTSFFTKINNIYKNTPPDAPEAEYIGSMYKKAKSIRDAFMEGAVAASKNAAQTKAETQQQFEKSYQKSKDLRKNARYSREHIAQLQSLDASTSTVPMDKLVERYESIIKIWNELGGEINSDFLKQWNDKSGKDRAFTVFKAQAGYKYNVELSSMCKKGIPLFEAIDQIVRSEVMSQLKTKTLGKAEKEILYELLKERKFDIPCAICYVEQARQREGDIIDAFLDGKVEKTSTGKTKTHKIGWNETFDALEKGMKSRGVDYKFIDVSRNIASDSYAKENIPAMDEKTQKAFYDTLLQLINKEITRYNAEKSANTKARLPLKSVTPAEIKRCLGGTLPANLKLYKTIAMNPDSRFRIQNDLLYSSETTTNLASYHHDLYSLFNMQGGVSGYKSKQGAVVYWGDILTKKWDSSKLRKEGGVRNQSNSDFMMYTLLDQAQMYIDFTAKGYYLQAYTKVISELKLFGLSKGKINASLIPRVELYRKDNGFEVDIEKTRENAGLDKDGNPIYDDIEGIPHEEAFMLIEDADYSKNIGGICIGYSDNHISKLLDDARIQLIIGYHDKTDDPDKRYYGARYAKNYNGENEARVKNADGTFTTKHVGFNQFVIAAEKLFKKDTTSVEYNGKTYKYDDIPKLAADMYLKMCADKNYIPAYDKFSSHENYYKLLADFSLYDSEGHYAPHQKVAYEMPDVVPYLDEDGNKKYMPSRDYIKKELEKELTVRDDIAATLSDHSEDGLIPQFVKTVNEMHESKDIRHQARVGIASDGKKIFQSNFPKGTPKAAKSERILDLIQNVWSKKPISLVISNGEKSRTILAQFDPTIDPNKIIPTDASKIAGGNRHGNHTEQRVTLDLADDYYEIASDAKYNYSKKETGKKQNTHNDVNMWHYFFTEIYFIEQGEETYTPYTVTVNVKEKDNGDFVYSFNAEKESSTRQTLHADVITEKGDNGELFVDNSISQSNEKSNTPSENSSEKHEIRSKARTTDNLGNELTDAQSEYFKDSKVRDSKGNLMVLYHGTTADFNVFKKGDVGYHFGTKSAARGRVGYGKNVTLKEVYLNITNPIAFDEDLGSWDADYRLTEELYNRGIITQEEAESVLLTDSKQYRRTTEQANKKLASLLLDKGYDGIEYTNTHETQKPTTSYIVFDSNQAKLTSNVNPTSDRDIRHKARTTVTTESTPYVSPTASSIVTEIDSGYDHTKWDKVSTASITAQIMFTNAQAGIEHRGRKYGVKNIESLVQAARTASSQAQEMLSGNQIRIGSDTKEYQGEGLEKIARPIFEMSAEKQRAFYDYLFHQHNADRMSLERRSTEWIKEKEAKQTEYYKKKTLLMVEKNKLEKEKSTLTRKKEDAAKRDKINTRLAEVKAELKTVNKSLTEIQKDIKESPVLKNKPVIGLNTEQVEAKKKELSQQISDLRKQRAKVANRKNFTEEMLKLTEMIEELTKELSNTTAEVTEEQSRKIVEEYEANYSDFLEIAEKIWNYNKNLNQYRVDTGLIDQATFDYLQKLYPHYVPTYRADTKTGIAAIKGKNNVAVNQSIKGAKGSTKDLLNPIVIMARQTMETVRAGRINQIADALYEGAKGDKTYISEVSKKKVNKSEAVDIDPMELRPKNNQVTFFKNGERITLQVSSDIFAGFDAFTPDATPNNPLKRAAAWAMDTFKKLVTSWNPTFLARNAIRDIQDAGINSKYGAEFAKAYKDIIAGEIRNDGEYWKLFKAMGGVRENYFDFDKGFQKQQTKRGYGAVRKDANAGKVKKVVEGAESIMQRMENLNNLIETLPRFAEFIASIKSGNTAEQAMLDAADVTTNFSRAGTVTKVANKYFIPFLNPAVQGASKAIRNITDAAKAGDGKKILVAYMKLAAKATIIGILPMLLNGLMYNDDEEYEDLRETDKENNFLIKIDGKFWKLPRGRMASVIGGLLNRAVFADEFDFKGYVANISTQMSPVESASRTIFSPFVDVKNNVTWYGSAIEGKQFENLSPSQRYDESTSSIAIAMAKFLNKFGAETSPKKIHYLLDQYSGVIGDFVLPATTNKAEKGFISGNFTLDPVTSNKLSDKFYDMYYEAQYAKNENENDKVAEYQVKHLNRVKSAISEMYEEKSKIQNSNLSDKAKREQTEAIQILINEMYKTAIEDYELLTNAIKNTSSVDDEYRYAEVIRLVYGAEEALEVYNTKVYEKSTLMNSAGISYDLFYNYYFTTRGIESDVDKKGNTIPGSKKEKFIKQIEKLKATDNQKLLLISISGYAIDDEKDKKKLLKYINSMKLTIKQKKELAELCGFEYKNGKIISKS